MAVTTKQIARELGVSEAAVSLALNQKPGVSEATRRRIFACAKALGYDMRRLRSTGTSNSNVVLVHYQRHIHAPVPFFSTLLTEAEQALRKENISLTSVVVDATEDIPARLSDLAGKETGGFIVLGTEMDRAQWEPFSRLDTPVVLLDGFVETEDLACITINNRMGARQATKLLLAEGRGCPGYLHANIPLFNFRERMEGYMSAIHDEGFSTANAQVHAISTHEEAAEADFSALLDDGLVPARGYFADNDFLAIGAMRALQAHGYRVPEDVSIVGFDNAELSRFVTPALTSVNVPLGYYARTAVEALRSLMHGGEHHGFRIEIGTTLVRRASTL